jgi:hypothetical protein
LFGALLETFKITLDRAEERTQRLLNVAHLALDSNNTLLELLADTLGSKIVLDFGDNLLDHLE